MMNNSLGLHNRYIAHSSNYSNQAPTNPYITNDPYCICRLLPTYHFLYQQQQGKEETKYHKDMWLNSYGAMRLNQFPGVASPRGISPAVETTTAATQVLQLLPLYTVTQHLTD
ncbi:uncharacterized protein AKAW2_10252S [Aspergillus luchuensis]|uniref:Uncharacterized protein n=1 Tax=Aspergillus kawachii TaxID=1069201 RepID=A0A7R7VYP1_ASPKA|nr:uncharacterized protein AKAW2_10252S [Aspergillus luchuensis]BCR93206.1 hypothetical protein AKAW2_10252S [Aspergillus luchuensis]